MSELVETSLSRRPIVPHSSKTTVALSRRRPANPRQASLLGKSRCRSESVPSSDVRRRVLTLPGSFEPEAWIDRPRPADLAGAAADGSGFKNVVCITLYNEPFELLRNSLSALLVSIGAQGSVLGRPEIKSCVVIIADGRNRIDPRIMRFFAD